MKWLDKIKIRNPYSKEEAERQEKRLRELLKKRYPDLVIDEPEEEEKPCYSR